MTDMNLDDQLQSALKKQALAEAKETTAKAEQREAEAKKATDAANRARENAADQDQRDRAKAEAENRRAIAEANVAAVKAYLPDATLKPLEGTVTTDDKSGIVAESVAYALVQSAAGKLADRLKNELISIKGDSRLLLATSRDFVASDWQYRTLRVQLDQLTSAAQAIVKVLAEPMSGARPAAGLTSRSSLPKITSFGTFTARRSRAKWPSST
jgi:hypothetical protein